MSKLYRMMHDGPIRKRPLIPARTPRQVKDVDRTKESPLVAPPRSSEPQQWRIVMTAPRREREAIIELTRAGYVGWFPQETVWVSRPNKRERAKINRPLFPRYVFVALRSNAIRAIRDCKHITGLLPYRPSEALIDNLYDRQEGREFDAAKAEADKRKALVGQTVRIVNGPFATFDGLVTMAEHERIEVLVSVFARPTPVALDFNDIAA